MALLWAMYLFFAAIETIFSVRVLGMRDAGLFLPTSRALLALLAMGVVLLWPMARLSQASPARPLRAAAADIIAIALPALAVVAPLKLLTEWPWDVMAGLGAMMLSWSLLIGALLAKGTARPPKKARTGWMLLCLAMVAAAPLAQLLLQSLGVSAPPMGLLSPLTGVFELTSAPSGLVPSMSISDWLGVAAPAVVAIPAWALAALSVASGGDRPSPA